MSIGVRVGTMPILLEQLISQGPYLAGFGEKNRMDYGEQVKEMLLSGAVGEAIFSRFGDSYMADVISERVIMIFGERLKRYAESGGRTRQDVMDYLAGELKQEAIRYVNTQ